jgi:DNA-binding LacI/PurR family transcriptional regulator
MTHFTKKSAAEQVAQALRDWIHRKQPEIGSYLPPSRQLAEELQVGLNTVQAAVRVLEREGLVECIARRGGVIKAIPRLESRRDASQIGVVHPLAEDESSGPDSWSNCILRAFQRQLAGHACQLVLFSPPVDDARLTQNIIEQLRQTASSLAGVMCFPRSGSLPTVAKELDRLGIPWLTIGCAASQHEPHNFVMVDQYHCGQLLGRLFADLGYTRVVYITTAQHPYTGLSHAQIPGINQAYIDAGHTTLEMVHLFCKDWHERSAYRATAAYLADGARPQAIYCAGARHAIGTIRACEEAGLRVPDDISVVGGTNLSLASYSRPRLTVISEEAEVMGEAAAKLFLKLVEVDRSPARLPGTIIPARLILRDSCLIPDRISEGHEAYVEYDQAVFAG